MKVVFMGTPDFSAAILERLVKDGHTVTGVITQADKPQGRHMVLTPPPVKVCAEQYGIPVFQPVSLKNGEAVPFLTECDPEVIVVAAYGMILRKDILEFPKYGCLNVHASLLPRWRGAAPINRVILEGETETGVTIMQMDAGLDTGDMLLKKAIPIGENETAGELFDRVAALGADLISEALVKLEAGTLAPEKQDDSLMTYAGMLSKKDSPVDWNKSAKQVHNQIRGLSPWPGASSVLNGKTMKLHASLLSDLDTGSCLPGTLMQQGNRLFAVCGDKKAVELITVQPQGSRKMSAEDYLRGHPVTEHTRFEF